jgi:hypothetical protein
MKREEVRKYAAPFLSLPDIADKKYKDRYSEEELIEAERQLLSITSTAKNENEEIQKQIIFIGLDDINSGKVQSIYVDRYITSGDSTVEQQLFWVIDKLFSVQNIIEKEGRPGKIHSTKVAWQ